VWTWSSEKQCTGVTERLRVVKILELISGMLDVFRATGGISVPLSASRRSVVASSLERVRSSGWVIGEAAIAMLDRQQKMLITSVKLSMLFDSWRLICVIPEKMECCTLEVAWSCHSADSDCEDLQARQVLPNIRKILMDSSSIGGAHNGGSPAR